jgi:hypothetical protein
MLQFLYCILMVHGQEGIGLEYAHDSTASFMIVLFPDRYNEELFVKTPIEVNCMCPWFTGAYCCCLWTKNGLRGCPWVYRC